MSLPLTVPVVERGAGRARRAHGAASVVDAAALLPHGHLGAGHGRERNDRHSRLVHGGRPRRDVLQGRGQPEEVQDASEAVGPLHLYIPQNVLTHSPPASPPCGFSTRLPWAISYPFFPFFRRLFFVAPLAGISLEVVSAAAKWARAAGGRLRRRWRVREAWCAEEAAAAAESGSGSLKIRGSGFPWPFGSFFRGDRIKQMCGGDRRGGH